MSSLRAVTYETLQWDRDPAAGYGTAARRQAGSYHAAIAAPIAGLDITLPSAVLAEVDNAVREVSRFDAELGGEIAPFASVLLRSESASSSRIEKLTASARAIAEAELGDTTKHNAVMIVGNTKAMTAASALAARIDADAILATQAPLMHRGRPYRSS